MKQNNLFLRAEPARSPVSFARWLLFSAFVLLSGAGRLAANPLGPPPKHVLQLRIGDSSIEVMKASAGSTVVVIGYERIYLGSEPTYRRVHGQAVAAGDGTATVDITRPLEPDSFWVAVDLRTGAHGASGHSKKKTILKERKLPDSAVAAGQDGKRKNIKTSFAYSYDLMVRPGVGAWEATFADGGPDDADRAFNGVSEGLVSEFSQYGGYDKSLDSFQNGDLVIVFLPRQMAVLFNEVGR